MFRELMGNGEQQGSERSPHAPPFPLGESQPVVGLGVGSYLPFVQVSRPICQVEFSLSPAVCQTELSSQHPSALGPVSWLPFFGRAIFFLRAHGACLLGSQEQVGEVDSEFSDSAAPSLLLAAHTAWIPFLCLSGQNSGFHKVHWSHSKGSLGGQGSRGGVHDWKSCSLRLILPSFPPLLWPPIFSCHDHFGRRVLHCQVPVVHRKSARVA